MPRHKVNASTISAALELLIDNGFEGLSRALELLLNEAMLLDRSRYLEASPYERTEARRGHANGFKSKQVNTRVGALALRVPQVRDSNENGKQFYPSLLEWGQRS